MYYATFVGLKHYPTGKLIDPKTNKANRTPKTILDVILVESVGIISFNVYKELKKACNNARFTKTYIEILNDALYDTTIYINDDMTLNIEKFYELIEYKKYYIDWSLGK